MVRILIITLLTVLGFMGYMAYDTQQRKAQETPTPIQREAEAFLRQLPQPRTANVAASVSSTPQFRCDGRTMCSQMTSCEEATYFLKHCPNTKMDGDGDGIPCERQHC